jgi:putative ABC transport system permease protein
MFGRLLWKLLQANRGRLAVALVALVSGGTVTSALMNLDLDVERKLTQEFRTLGANFVVSMPRESAPDLGPASPALMDESVLSTIQKAQPSEVIAAAPYLFIVAEVRGQKAAVPVVVAGTWLDQMPRLEPWWKIQGDSVASRDDLAQCLVGRNVARQFGLSPGSALDVHYGDRQVRLRVAGIGDTGGAEDNQIFVNLPVAQTLAGVAGRIELVQLSVSGAPSAMEVYAARIAAALPGFEVRPIRQITQAEGGLLSRIRLLVLAMVLLILGLTALCVLATMAALAMERRVDVGLMKAIGGSISRVTGLFLAEVGVLGIIGGLVGYSAGIELSVWMGRKVFGAAISPRLEVLPLTVALMVGVALAGALPLRALGKVRPAVILRGE